MRYLQSMKRKFVKTITILALVALLLLQGIWVFDTYSLIEKNLTVQLEERFERSIVEEIFLRLDSSSDVIPRTGAVVRGARPDKDPYENALAFHEFLLLYKVPLSLEKLDSLWMQKLSKDFRQVNYLILKTDSVGTTLERIKRGAKEKAPFTLIITKPVRKDNSEFLQLIIESPQIMVLRQMIFLFVSSLIIAIILIYCLFLQIRIIVRQEQIAKIRHDFTQAMVHDMKHPVTNILMSADLLKTGKKGVKNRIKENCVDIINKEGNRLLAFTNKILTIAKFESHKIELKKRNLDLQELIGRLMAEYPSTSSKEILFTTDMEDNIHIHADPEYMDDVFRNLIENAIKYSKETVAIHITGKIVQNHTIVKIRDNGIGISSRDQKRIFQQYERACTKEKEEKGGFGLGLYYVYQVVSAHGGTVNVESVPDLFSEFTINLPNNS